MTSFLIGLACGFALYLAVGVFIVWRKQRQIKKQKETAESELPIVDNTEQENIINEEE